MVTALKSLLQFSAKEVFLYLYIFAVAQLGVYLTHVEMVGRSCEDGGAPPVTLESSLPSNP